MNLYLRFPSEMKFFTASRLQFAAMELNFLSYSHFLQQVRDTALTGGFFHVHFLLQCNIQISYSVGGFSQNYGIVTLHCGIFWNSSYETNEQTCFWPEGDHSDPLIFTRTTPEQLCRINWNRVTFLNETLLWLREKGAKNLQFSFAVLVFISRYS